jgi:small subunit ribosomal protein S21
MIIVEVNGNIDKALKKFKRKFEKIGIIKELRDRQYFEKASVKKRNKKLKAIYVEKKFGNNE